MSEINSFDNTHKLVVSIREAAEAICVSEGTIKNWIKLGRLESAGGNQIYRHSLDICTSESIGRERLNSRVNKLHKPKNENEDLEFHDPSRWQEYEESLSESHRNREGIYYTPEHIVEDMFSKIEEEEFTTKKFLDPCCGSGNFIIGAIKMGMLPQNVYGYDIDPNAVEITKNRIKELTGYDTKNIKCRDFLQIAGSVKIRFDYIFTNPPWGKRVDKSSRRVLAHRYGASKNSDSSTLFIYAALPLLKKGGKMGFLLQEALFNIGAYADIRERLLAIKIDHFIDYGRAFRTLLTKACAIIATNQAHEDEEIRCCCKGVTHTRRRTTFTSNPHFIFNFNTSRVESEVIELLLNREHATLKGAAEWGLGIVTGDNKRFCSDSPKDGFEPIYRGSDITNGVLKSPSLYLDPNLSLYQQSAPMRIYKNPNKIVYKFISTDLCFLLEREGRLILNSANCLILNEAFPITPVELVKFLNCDFTNWLFKRLFSTRKILRGDLEALPIFPELFTNGIFCEESYLRQLNITKSEEGSYRIIK